MRWITLALAVNLLGSGCVALPSRPTPNHTSPVSKRLPRPKAAPPLLIADRGAEPQPNGNHLQPAANNQRQQGEASRDPEPQPAGNHLLLAAASQQAQGVANRDFLEHLRLLHRKALDRHLAMDSYTLRLQRREATSDGQAGQDEVILLKFRQKPWSIAFKWIGEQAKGREVLYVKGRKDDLIHIRTAAGDIPFLPAGRHMKFSPDSILVKSRSRYPITDSGLDGAIERFGRLVEALTKGDTKEGTARYLGAVRRPEFAEKMEGVLQTLPPGVDPLLPRGGQCQWYFDHTWNLPLLTITHDEAGREVDYSCHDRLEFPVGLDDDDFDPDKLWKAPGK